MAAVVVESAQTLMGLWIVGDICSCELRRQLKDLLLRVSRQGRERSAIKARSYIAAPTRAPEKRYLAPRTIITPRRAECYGNM